ncbi:Ig-like domain-containing protein [Levilactobacillus brevis]|uniref:Ig-like domain-containing protein n=1 Tax=Levilactobacillus brevis TaxID=1580 RepID=UPI000E04B626|nr:Ig-like domain-containing protein [Levilactobacillus brevis]STX20753.1 Extracellular protein [Levilactobacillus brevis]
MKKFMVALTGLVTLATVGATVPATAVTTAHAATKSTYVSPSLKVNAIYTTSTKVAGTATKGSKITVKATKNAKTNLASGTASKTTGKYSIKLSKKLKKNANVYVYATNSKTKAYFYRIIRVQAASTKAATTKSTSTKKTATKKTTTKKTTTKKTTTKKTTTKKTTTKKTTTKKSTTSSKTSTANFSVKTPTGTWTSNTANKYSQKWVFSQKTGLNEYLYKNGKKVKTLVSYAKYSVSAKTPTFWKITYTPKGSKTKQTMYLRFTSAKKFKVVNSKNQVISTKAGVAPAAKWTFTKA